MDKEYYISQQEEEDFNKWLEEQGIDEEHNPITKE